MGDRKRILVVDDSRMLATAVERILQKQDYEVITAISAIEGFDKAKEEKPDVIILDVIIPGINGYEVGRELRQDPETSDIPIIFLSGESHNQLALCCMRCAALKADNLVMGTQHLPSASLALMKPSYLRVVTVYGIH